MSDSKNILVVEDDLDIRELISFNLKNEVHAGDLSAMGKMTLVK